MDTITSIKTALNEWISEDPDSRRKLLIRDPALTKILKRAEEIKAQRWLLIAEKFWLYHRNGRVDQGEVILSDRT
jgi:hypothetical protein